MTKHKNKRWLAWPFSFISIWVLVLGTGCFDSEEQPPVPPSDCVSNESYFQDSVWNPIMSARCIGCHVEGGLAGETRMVLRQPGDDHWLSHNLAQIQDLAGIEDDGVSLFLSKPAGQHAAGHVGGELIAPGSADLAVMTALVGRLTGSLDACGRPAEGMENPINSPPVGDCAEPAPGRRMTRRLSHGEYANTIRDLLGMAVDARTAFAADVVVHGFDNHAAALDVSPILADQYRSVAESLADAADLAPLLACPLAGGDAACAQGFITEFGLRAFRRPLTNVEIGRYQDLYVDVARDDGFETGIRWVLTALLQSPHFLYRTELGRRTEAGFELTSYEIAAELSYLIWQSIPDDALLDAAATGALLDPAEVDAQARRLLADPKSAGTVQRFTALWLGIDQLSRVTRDAEVYPEFTPEVRTAMIEETNRFIGNLWQSGGTLGDLFLSDHTWVDPRLAGFYGVELGEAEPGPDGFRRVSLAGTPYAGILTHGSVLTTHALPTTSSPIHRGLLVRERFLCQELPPPPMNLNVAPPPVDPELTTRDRYAQHSSEPACAGCHNLVDPIGFAFEHFDGVGRYRERDGLHAIDDRGEIRQSPNSDAGFEGVSGLAVGNGHLSDHPLHHPISVVTLLVLRRGPVVTGENEVRCRVALVTGPEGRELATLLRSLVEVHQTLNEITLLETEFVHLDEFAIREALRRKDHGSSNTILDDSSVHDTTTLPLGAEHVGDETRLPRPSVLVHRLLKARRCGGRDDVGRGSLVESKSRVHDCLFSSRL